MTITYSLSVSKSNFVGFGKLLLRWRGSIYKLIFKELIFFAVLYYFFLILYRVVLTGDSYSSFTALCMYFRDFIDIIPLTFVLGFYVSLVVGRWWEIYMNLPWVDRTSLLIATYVHGSDERGRQIRRNLVRYINIMQVLCLRSVSTVVKKRFPTLQHVVDSGIMTEDELQLLESVGNAHGTYFMPAYWFGSLAMQARKEGRVHDDYFLKAIMDELNNVRGCCGNLMSYDWISIPLVYTQVVTIATYAFFFACLFGRQFLSSEDAKYGRLSMYFPLFTFVQFFFYMGWLKVAEALINPLGEDDDDFELNYVIDRNVQVGFIMVDELSGKYPKLCRDPFWNELDPVIPYTAAASSSYKEPFLGSAINIRIPEKRQEWAVYGDEEEDMARSVSHRSASAASTPALAAKLSTIFSRSVSQLSRSSTHGPKRMPRPSNASDLHIANLKRHRSSVTARHHRYTQNRKISTASALSVDSLGSIYEKQGFNNAAYSPSGDDSDTYGDNLYGSSPLSRPQSNEAMSSKTMQVLESIPECSGHSNKSSVSTAPPLPFNSGVSKNGTGGHDESPVQPYSQEAWSQSNEPVKYTSQIKALETILEGGSNKSSFSNAPQPAMTETCETTASVGNRESEMVSSTERSSLEAEPNSPQAIGSVKCNTEMST